MYVAYCLRKSMKILFTTQKCKPLMLLLPQPIQSAQPLQDYRQINNIYTGNL